MDGTRKCNGIGWHGTEEPLALNHLLRRIHSGLPTIHKFTDRQKTLKPKIPLCLIHKKAVISLEVELGGGSMAQEVLAGIRV